MKIVFNSLKDGSLATAQAEYEGAFLNIFESFKDKVYSYCRHVTHSETIAEDITQEVFMKVWLQMASLADVNNIEAWMITIARNHCFNYLKKKAIEQKFVEVSGNTSQEMNGCNNSDDYINYKDQLSRLTQAVNSLPYRQRIIFNLNRNEGLKNEEIACQLDISTHTVKSHFVKALRKVRGVMQAHSAILISAFLLNKYFF